MVFGRALAAREPLVKAAATLGLALVLLGVMDLLWRSGGAAFDRASDRQRRLHVGQVNVTDSGHRVAFGLA